MSKKAIIIGTGRSGTGFTSHLLRNCGYDVGHEYMGKDGTSSWYLANENSNVLGVSWEEISKTPHVIGHQVRHPLKAIPSLMTINKESWSYINKTTPFLDEDRKIIKRAMRHWLDWNQLAAEKAKHTWTLEQIDHQIMPFIEDVGFDIEKSELKLQKMKLKGNTNSSKSRVNDVSKWIHTSPVVLLRRLRQAYCPIRLDWEKLHRIDHSLADDILNDFQEYCKRALVEEKKVIGT